jgi:hypothetical protein
MVHLVWLEQAKIDSKVGTKTGDLPAAVRIYFSHQAFEKAFKAHVFQILGSSSEAPLTTEECLAIAKWIGHKPQSRLELPEGHRQWDRLPRLSAAVRAGMQLAATDARSSLGNNYAFLSRFNQDFVRYPFLSESGEWTAPGALQPNQISLKTDGTIGFERTESLADDQLLQLGRSLNNYLAKLDALFIASQKGFG